MCIDLQLHLIDISCHRLPLSHAVNLLLVVYCDMSIYKIFSPVKKQSLFECFMADA
jgi:hypothetical protein